LDDLESIWKIQVLDEIKVPVELDGVEKLADYPSKEWNFIMDSNGFYLKSDSSEHCIYDKYTFALIKNKRVMMLKKIGDLDIIFIKEYDSIREKIIEKVENAIKEKKEEMDIIEKINKKYKNEAVVEIDLPESKNPQTIDIKRENSQNVGEINFGYATIRLITKGNIVLVNDSVSEKEKSKNK